MNFQKFRPIESMTEKDFSRDIVVPLLSELGARYIHNLHGADEDGKDLAFLFPTLDGEFELHVAQVKNAKFTTGRSKSTDYAEVLLQLQRMATHDAINPKTLLSERPTRLWLISGHGIPHQKLLRARAFCDQLAQMGVKIIDGVRIRELLRERMTHLYLRHCSPQDAISELTLRSVEQHDELRLFGAHREDRIDSVFVEMDLAPSNCFFRRIVNRQLQLADGTLTAPKRTADRILIANFSELAPDKIKGESDPRRVVAMLETGFSPSLSDLAAYLRELQETVRKWVSSIQRSQNAFRRLRSKSSRLAAVTSLLTRLAIFECAVSRLYAIFPSDLFAEGPTGITAKSFKIPEISPLELLSVVQRIVILGPPGAGKTFQAKMAFATASKSNTSAVFFPCAAYSATNGGLAQNIEKYWHRKNQVTLPRPDDDKHDLFDGTLILDGLDEAAGRIPSLLEAIDAHCQHFPNSRVCLTCRTAVANELPGTYFRVELTGLNDAQMSSLFKKWFHDEKSRVQSLEMFLHAHPRIKEAARSPMVATILCVLHENGRELPSTYADIYRNRFELLLDGWDRGRNVNRNIYEVRDKWRLLERIAFQTHRAGRRTFSMAEYRSAFSRELGGALYSSHELPFLRELIENNGVLEMNSERMLSFGHLSNQEYLAARYHKERQRAKALADRFGDAWWDEVLRFYAQLSGDVSAVLRAVPALKLSRYSGLAKDMTDRARYTPGDIVAVIGDGDFAFAEADFVSSMSAATAVEEIMDSGGGNHDAVACAETWGTSCMKPIEDVFAAFANSTRTTMIDSNELDGLLELLRLLRKIGWRTNALERSLKEIESNKSCRKRADEIRLNDEIATTLRQTVARSS